MSVRHFPKASLDAWQARQDQLIFDQWMDVQAFELANPPLPIATPLPRITWEEIERQLIAQAATSQMAQMAPDLIAMARKTSSGKPSEMIVHDLIAVIALATTPSRRQEDSLEARSLQGEVPMT